MAPKIDALELLLLPDAASCRTRRPLRPQMLDTAHGPKRMLAIPPIGYRRDGLKSNGGPKPLSFVPAKVRNPPDSEAETSLKPARLGRPQRPLVSSYTERLQPVDQRRRPPRRAGFSDHDRAADVAGLMGENG